jgi:hypothetical protein
VPQALKVAERLPAQDQREGQVDQQLAAVVDRGEAGPAHRRGQRGPQPQALGQQPQRQRAGEPDQPIVVADQLQPVGP